MRRGFLIGKSSGEKEESPKRTENEGRSRASPTPRRPNPSLPNSAYPPPPTFGNITIKTLPPIRVGSVRDPDGHTVWWARDPTFTSITRSPGFPVPVPRPHSNAFEIRDTHDMGKGVFATRDIKKWEFIYAERPLIMTSIIVGSNVGPMLDLSERVLGAVLSAMNEDDRRVYLDLHVSHDYLQVQGRPLLRRLQSNGYGIDVDGIGRERRHSADMYTAVGRVCARINHSCMPNVLTSFKRSAVAMKINACRDIKAGEQLFTSYVEVAASQAERQAGLIRYGFVCRCRSCTDGSATTDEKRLKMENWSVGVLHQLEEGRTPNTPNLLQTLLDWRQFAQDEGLEGHVAYRIIMQALQIVYHREGKVGEAEALEQELQDWHFPYDEA